MQLQNIRLLLGISFGIVTICLAQITNENTNPPFAPKSSISKDTPNKDTIVIVSNRKSWTISQLNRIATQYLWDKGSMPKGLAVESSVQIYAHDNEIMCEFLYLERLGRPFWFVKFGFDGMVKGYGKQILMEKPQ